MGNFTRGLSLIILWAVTGVGAKKGAFRDLNLGHLDTLVCGSQTVSEDKLTVEKKSRATHKDSEYDLLRLLKDIVRLLPII